MKFKVTGKPIDAVAARHAVADPYCGALAVFEGWVRDHNEGRAVERLEYEVYRPLAEKEGARIIDEAIERFGVSHAVCIHREGLLELGDIAVIVCVSSPHRAVAFDACRDIIDGSHRGKSKNWFHVRERNRACVEDPVRKAPRRLDEEKWLSVV